MKDFYKGPFRWKYENNGEYDKEEMLDWVKIFCGIEEIEYNPEILYSNSFVEFILIIAKDYSTNVKGAGKFLKKNQKIYDNGYYSIYSADCLFKTFLHILAEMRRKEIIEEQRRRQQIEIENFNKEIEERRKLYEN